MHGRGGVDVEDAAGNRSSLLPPLHRGAGWDEWGDEGKQLVDYH